MVKLSFLVPAHNEEKYIASTLQNLLTLPYSDYEILVGLDGCTDRTPQIVAALAKKFRRIRLFNLNIRQGKPAVITALAQKARGSILIIHDVDWIFKVTSRATLSKAINLFKDPSVGGIAESYPVEWEDVRRGSLGYQMVAHSSYFWLKFQKETFTTLKNRIRTVTNPTMFLTNILRKELYQKNTTLGDDFERTADIFQKGYKIVLFEDIKMPRMVAQYRTIRIRDIFKQKIRTSLARSQLSHIGKANFSLPKYYFAAVPFIFLNGFRKSLYIGLLMTLWIMLTATATMVSKFSSLKSTREGWRLRAKR